jgi:hypothetical protein
VLEKERFFGWAFGVKIGKWELTILPHKQLSVAGIGL